MQVAKLIEESRGWKVVKLAMVLRAEATEILGRREWENKAGKREAKVKSPIQRSSQKAIERPFTISTLEMERKNSRPAEISFQIVESRA